LLRQPPWECLASFILSSTKQIVQIRQIIELLCEQFGDPVEGPQGNRWRAFPSPSRLAAVSEAELRACKMGFRAKYLHIAAQVVTSGDLDLDQLKTIPPAEVRHRLMQLNGVGEKIADCVRLFAYGHADAFPIDVWVARALRQYYFRGRNIPLPRLRAFAADRWQGYGGYAQQYFFHHIRSQPGKTARGFRARH
jgi:N-glycosylase/DNA lyase